MTKQEKKFEKLLNCFKSKDAARPHLMKAVVKEGNLLATDGHQLIKISDYSSKNGVYINGTIFNAAETVNDYPDFKQVIPNYYNGGRILEINFDFIKKIKTKKGTQVYVDLNGTVSFSANDNTVFSIDLHCLEFLNYVENDLTKIEIEYIDSTKPIRFFVNVKYIPSEKITILVMPMMFEQ